MAARIEMEFVRNLAGGKDFVESNSAGVESEIVFGTAVEIDTQARKRSAAGESEWAVAVPKGRVWRQAEDAAEEAGTAGSGDAAIAGKKDGQFFDESRAVGADGREQFGMSEGEMEGAVAAHGNAGNGAIGAAGTDAVAVFDERKKFPQEEGFVADFAVAGVDIEASPAGGSGDEEFLEAAFFAEILDEVPAAGVEKCLLVVAESVEEIENGEAARFVGIKAGRQKDAVRNRARKDFAGDGVAFGAAGRGVGAREVKEVGGS
jgi:hypothetical protein